MNINATLIGQMITFAFFVWFTMRFVWPPIVKALEERRLKIASGLAAAERGNRELELAQHRVAEDLREAKLKAQEIVEHAHVRASQILDEAKVQGQKETKRMLDEAQQKMAMELNKAKNELRSQVALIAVASAEKILQHELKDKPANERLIQNLIDEWQQTS